MAEWPVAVGTMAAGGRLRARPHPRAEAFPLRHQARRACDPSVCTSAVAAVAVRVAGSVSADCVAACTYYKYSCKYCDIYVEAASPDEAPGNRALHNAVEAARPKQAPEQRGL